MITKTIDALKGNLPLVAGAVAVIVIAAAAGTAGWIYANRTPVQEVEAPQTTPPDAGTAESESRQARLPEAAETPDAGTAESESRQARLPEAAETPAAGVTEGPPESGQTLPDFDVVRVEPDGGAVIAGQAEPGSKVVLFANSKPVAETEADATGSWALVLEKPLPAGASDLWLSAEKAGLPKVRSMQSVAVVIDPDKTERPLVVVQDASGSRVLQKPEIVALAKPTETPQPPSAAEEPAPSVAEPPSQPVAKEPSATSSAPVSIEAADYDVDGSLHISGLAAPSATIRLYYDDVYVGDAEANAEGRWSLSVKRGLDGAAHTVRADVVAPGSADILARSEVSFIAELPESERRRLAEATEAAKTEPPPGTQVAAATDQPMTVSDASAAPDRPDAAGAPEGVVEQDTPTSTESVAESVATARAPATGEATPTPTDPDMAAAEPTAKPPAPVRLAEVGADPRIPNRITVVRGDNLWRISRTFYGRGIRYTTIFQANREQIRNPHWIYPGQVFLIPRLKTTDETVN